MMVYEDTGKHYSYGMSIYVTNYNTGLGLFGSSGANVPDHGAGGTLPHLYIQNTGNVAIGHVAPAANTRLHVVGNILASGSITGATKAFCIDHPTASKAAQGYKLRHWCVETADCPGGSVQYRRTIDMTSTTQSFDMDSWFPDLVKDAIVMVTPYQHFGSAWGEVSGATVTIHATTLGKWHCLITASRNDICATTMCEQEVEFIPTPPEEGEPLPP
jgi:hypothetical protein